MLNSLRKFFIFDLNIDFIFYISFFFLTLVQLLLLIFADPYFEKDTLLAWFYGPMGLIESYGMRITPNGEVKGSYSFIYLLPTYLFFILNKFIGFSDSFSLIFSNFLTINLGLFLLLLASRKLHIDYKITIIVYSIFFLTTFMWAGIIRTFPHDIMIILALTILIFPSFRIPILVFMIYVDPIIGSLFGFFYFLHEFIYKDNGNLRNLVYSAIKIIFITILGFLLWVVPIYMLETQGFFVERGSIVYRIFGAGDEYFFSRIQIFTPFHYYLPNAISTIFPSILFAVGFGASNLITPAGMYLIYSNKDYFEDIIQTPNSFFVFGAFFIFSYLIFALIFGQAAASHRFDYDQYFQIGVLFCLIDIMSKNAAITNSLVFKAIILYSFLVIIPFLVINIIF